MRQQGRTNVRIQAEADKTAAAALAAEPNLIVTGMEMACTECGLLTTCWCDGVTNVRWAVLSTEVDHRRNVATN